MLKFKDKIVNTKLAEFLYKKLLSIRNDTDYVLCLMHDLDNDNQRQQLLDVIDSGLNDTDDLIFYALKISGVKTVPVSELRESDF